MLTIQVCSLAASWRPLSCSPIFLSVTQFLNVYIDMYKIVQCSYCNTCEYFTVSHLNTLFIHISMSIKIDSKMCFCVYQCILHHIYSCILHSCITAVYTYWPIINIKTTLCNGVPSLTTANILVSLRCQAKRSIE